ncbi:MAG: MFS transporter [Dethiobacter sp.]|nr:MFS transporter [Dethiobacter sp.]
MNKKRWLYLLCLAEVGTMLVLLNYSAVLPIIKEEWGLTNTQSGLIFSSYQVGYIMLVVILSTLTDYIDTKKIYVFSALWAGLAGMLFAVFARGFVSALILRSLTGFGLAGTYMPGLKLVSAKFPSEERGQAVGIYVGAFSVGTALSMYAAGVLTGIFHWRAAMFITSCGPVMAALLAWRILENVPPQRRDGKRGKDVRREVFTNRPVLLVISGYMAHMWEMFGMRGWIVAFFVAVLSARGSDLTKATSFGAQIASLIILAGAFSTALAGKLSDRYGRAKTIQIIMLSSAACSLLFGWTRTLPLAMIVLISLVYGFLVTAESSVLSTSVTEMVAFPYLGTAMALQSFLGWSAASVSPVVFGAILDMANPAAASSGFTPNWGPAFAVLGIGALWGPLAMQMLKKYDAREDKNCSTAKMEHKKNSPRQNI